MPLSLPGRFRTAPAEIKSAISEIIVHEGGFNPTDRNGFPALNGITADTWATWVANNGGPRMREDQAADDLRAIAGRGGRSYTGISLTTFAAHAREIAYQAYFKSHGFDELNSPAIQRYITEISFHRGPGAASWALMFAAGAESSNADPNYDRRVPRSPERRNAVDYANGFLASGRENRIGSDSSPVNGDAEARFYARLRVAKMLMEAHFVKDGEADRQAYGLMKRAFEYEWSIGSADNVNLNSQSDRPFEYAFERFKSLYERRDNNTITDSSFRSGLLSTLNGFKRAEAAGSIPARNIAPSEAQVTALPSSTHRRSEARSAPQNRQAPQSDSSSPVPDWIIPNQLVEKYHTIQASEVKPDWDLNMARAVASAATLTSAVTTTASSRPSWNVAVHTASQNSAPSISAANANIPAGRFSAAVQYRDLGGLPGAQAIAIAIRNFPPVRYDIDNNGNFENMHGSLPRGMTLLEPNKFQLQSNSNTIINPYNHLHTLTWEDNGIRRYLPLSAELNNEIKRDSASRPNFFNRVFMPFDFKINANGGFAPGTFDYLHVVSDGQNSGFSVRDVDKNENRIPPAVPFAQDSSSSSLPPRNPRSIR